MASNGEWGEVQVDSKFSKIYEEFSNYPALELTPALQTFLDSRGLEFNDLIRLGARQTFSAKGTLTLVYHFPEGLKFRPINDEPRWNSRGTEWNLAKKIKAIGVISTDKALIVEGETDAALMSRIMPTFDIFILPAGAQYISEAIVAQLKPYKTVYVGLDNDVAGVLGAEKLLLAIPESSKIIPPSGKDWCDSALAGSLVGWKPIPTRIKVVYTFQEIIDTDFGAFEANNWFKDPILPVGGQMLIHAPKKSLKSVIAMELIKAIATGTEFAGFYEFVREAGPGKVLLIQMEIPPYFFQLRLMSWLATLPPHVAELFRKNAYTYGVGDNRLPRLNIRDKMFKSTVYRALQDSEAEVVVFDPIQRITGDGSLDKANEMDQLLDFFAELQNQGYTVVACHHNTKASGPASKDPNAMVGTQRFSGDADSLCSVWHDKTLMLADENPEERKQRNFTWTLRNGAAQGRSITTVPDSADPHLISVTFDGLITVPDAVDPLAPDFL